MIKMRTLLIAVGLTISILSIHAWAFNDNGMSTAQGIGSLVFGGEYYLTAPEDIMDNPYCGMFTHDVSVYGGKVAWSEEWDGDTTGYYSSHIVVYDLETKEYEYVNYTPDVIQFGSGGMYKPILTDEYVVFYLNVGDMLPRYNWVVIHELSNIDAENDVNDAVWGSWELGDVGYNPSEYDVYDANNDYLVWKPTGSGLVTLDLSNMFYSTYPDEINYGHFNTPSITEDNVVYYTATSGEGTTYYHIDSMDLETGNISQITPNSRQDYDMYGTAYENTLWWQNDTTRTDWDMKYDTQLLDVETGDIIFDTDVDIFNASIDSTGEWAYTMASHEGMGIYAMENNRMDVFQYVQNLTLVNFETGEEYVLETYDEDSQIFYDRYWQGYNPIRNQMIWQFNNGTYVIATEGGVGVVNIQYLIPTSIEDGLNHINIDKEIFEQQEEMVAKDYTLFFVGSITLMVTVVYAIWSIKEIQYEER